MGKVKAWYQDILEREFRYRHFDSDFDMMILENKESRRPLSIDEINMLAQEAANLDKSEPK